MSGGDPAERAELRARLREAETGLTVPQLRGMLRLLARLATTAAELTTGEVRALVGRLERRGASRAAGAPLALRLVGGRMPEDAEPPPAA